MSCGRTWTDGWGVHVCDRNDRHPALGIDHGCDCDATLQLDLAERPAPAGMPCRIGDVRDVEYFVSAGAFSALRTVRLKVVNVQHRRDGRWRVEHSLEGSGLTVRNLSPVVILESWGAVWQRPLPVDGGPR